jgi:hypothetical protein
MPVIKDPNNPNRLDQVDLRIEGTEDWTIRPWKGPSRPLLDQLAGNSQSIAQESFHVCIAKSEDLTVRPWLLVRASETSNS